MTSHKDELRIQAYLDNQLPVEEVIKIEERLTVADKVRLENEREFEAALVAKFMEDADCPETLWDETKLGLRSRIDLNSRRKFRKLLSSRWLAAAAIVVVAAAFLSFVSPESNNDTPAVEILFTQEFNDIRKFLEVPGDLKKVHQSLAANELPIAIKAPDVNGKHDIQLLGMRYHETAGQKIAQLYFSCCGKPLMVFLSKDSVNSIADYVHIVYDSETMYSVNNVIDNYRVLIIGPHSPADVLGLFS